MPPSDKPISLPDTLEDAERFQRLFVKPMVDAVCQKVQTQLEPLIETQRSLLAKDSEHDGRLTKLESSNKRAMVGWGVYASIAAAVIGSAGSWVKQKLWG